MSLATERSLIQQLDTLRMRLNALEASYDHALKLIEKLEQELLDHAEDWAMAGIPHGTDLSNKLAEHYYQRQRDRADAAKWREHIAKQEPVTGDDRQP
jgi:hypothetical protein